MAIGEMGRGVAFCCCGRHRRKQQQPECRRECNCRESKATHHLPLATLFLSWDFAQATIVGGLIGVRDKWPSEEHRLEVYLDFRLGRIAPTLHTWPIVDPRSPS